MKPRIDHAVAQEIMWLCRPRGCARKYVVAQTMWLRKKLCGCADHVVAKEIMWLRKPRGCARNYVVVQDDLSLQVSCMLEDIFSQDAANIYILYILFYM